MASVHSPETFPLVTHGFDHNSPVHRSFLCWFSIEQDGLGVDDGSSILLFGWRFTPSLLAVLYVQLTAMLLDDVKRTECFAQLARPGGAPAVSTLLRAPGTWWNALTTSLSKRNGSKRSWLLLSSALINVLGFLMISPLSPSLLESTDVAVTKNIQFNRIAPQRPLNLTIGRDTKLRILRHLLQNVTTSAWISDDYTILPFWPSDLASPPLGPLLSAVPQNWQANTLVLNTELECEPLSIIGTKTTSVYNITKITSTNNVYAGSISNNTWPWGNLNNTITLASNSGCTSNVTWIGQGSLWYSLATFPTSDTTIIEHSTETDAAWMASGMALRQSDKCGEKESILVAPGPNEKPDRSRFIGHLCAATYYMARLDVTAYISPTSSELVFNEDEYRKKRTKVYETFF